MFEKLAWLESSAVYMPIPLLIALYAVGLRKRLPKASLGLGIGTVMLLTSLCFRILDLPLCAKLPLGMHFLWHLINVVMLGWMIEVYRRHDQSQAGHIV